MARLYNTPPQKRYENKPIGGFLTARQAAYIAAGAALGLLFSSPLGRGLSLHTLILKGLVVLVFAGIAHPGAGQSGGDAARRLPVADVAQADRSQQAPVETRRPAVGSGFPGNP